MREERREDGGVRLAGRGCWVSRAGGRRARKLLDRWPRNRGRRRERGRISTGRECWLLRREGGGGGGLPDWMGPAMPWWSMGQVLGFSHCRESAFVLLFPSVCLCGRCAFVYLTVPSSYAVYSSHSQLTALSFLSALHSSLPPLINTWLNGGRQRRREGDLLCCCCLPLICRCLCGCVREGFAGSMSCCFSLKASVVLYISSPYSPDIIHNDIKVVYYDVHVFVCAEKMLRSLLSAWGWFISSCNAG